LGFRYEIHVYLLLLSSYSHLVCKLSLIVHSSSIHIHIQAKMATTQPTSQLIAATKGIAIAASFITTGSLLTHSTSILPIVLHSGSAEDSSAAQTAAQQFALAHRAGKKTLPPAEILSTLAFGFLAYHSNQNARSASTWKLYAGAAAAMFSVIPYTLVLMEQATLKLVQLADAPPHHADSQPSLSHKPQNGLLGVPGQSAVERPAITPAEEFEPFDDSPFSAEEYEKAKVQKMLKQWNTRNTIRIAGPLVAGVLGLWAALAE
jgi:hypothetical protein